MNSQPHCSSEKVQVVAIDGPWAWVEGQPKSACGGCSAHKVCGNGAMADLLGNKKPLRFKIRNDFEASVKEWIVVGWIGGSFMKTVALTYLVPSLLCVLLACLGGLQSEGASALGALVGLGLGLAICQIKTSGKKRSNAFDIVFLHRLEDMNHE